MFYLLLLIPTPPSPLAYIYTLLYTTTLAYKVAYLNIECYSVHFSILSMVS